MKLSSKQRKALPDTDFGLITSSGERKFPLHDKEHVLLAIRMFKHCPLGKEKELASKINAKLKDFGIKLNGSSTGAFTKYASSEAFSVSREASNVGTLEPIVGGSEIVSKEYVQNLKIPKGQKKMFERINDELVTEESYCKPVVSRFFKSKADKNGIVRVGSVLDDLKNRICDIIAIGEYNDTVKYTLDKHVNYGIDSWNYKDQLVEMYNQDYDDEIKVIDISFLISMATSDEQRYLLAVLYKLDSQNEYELLDKVIRSLQEDKKVQFTSFISPLAPSFTFGPFDRHETKYDYPEQFRFDFDQEVLTNSTVFELANYLEGKYDIMRDSLNPFVMRMLAADLVNRQVIDGYKVFSFNDIFKKGFMDPILVVKRNDMYGIGISENYTMHLFYYIKDRFYRVLYTLYNDINNQKYGIHKFDVDELHLEINLHKSYSNKTFEMDFMKDFDIEEYLYNMFDYIYDYGLNAIDNKELDSAKDALATLFTANRLVYCDNKVTSSTISNYNYKCKVLLKKIFTLESGFNFLKFYRDNGYEIYTEGKNAIDPKLAYNFIMGI